MLRSELPIPLIATAFIVFASATSFVALADPAKRTAWTWAVCALAIALILALNIYWFGIRPGNKSAAFALLERSGFIRTATDDPTLNESLSTLCATPYPPEQVISAFVLDTGRSRRRVVHGCAVHRRNVLDRGGAVVQYWTWVVEVCPVRVDGLVRITGRFEFRLGSLRGLPELTAGISSKFLESYVARGPAESAASGAAVPAALQQLFVEDPHPGFLETFHLLLSPRGWCLATFPVVSEKWMARLLDFTDRISAAVRDTR